MDRPEETSQLPGSSIQIPFMTRERFAALSGLEEGVLRGLIEKGHIPSVKLGRYRFVNLVALNRQLDTEVEL